jgi:hypothetical protein
MARDPLRTPALGAGTMLPPGSTARADGAAGSATRTQGSHAEVSRGERPRYSPARGRPVVSR